MIDMSEPEIVIRQLGGNCPVQSEGTIDGAEYYFRARHESWTLCIGGEDVILAPEWFYEEPNGALGSVDAGWMSEQEAETFLRQAAQRYHDQKGSA
jgi:hypothetical protein